MGRNWGRSGVRGACTAVVVGSLAAAASVVPTAAGASPAQAGPLTVSVSPSTGLVDEQVVTVSGTGLTPGGLAIAAECVTFPPPPDPPLLDGCQTSPGSGSGVADSAGNVSISVQLDAILSLAGGGVVNDCRTGFTCSFKLLDVSTGQTASQQIHFVTDAALVPGVLTVTPSTGLVDGQSVTVTGTNFDSALTLAQCTRGAGCDFAGADAASLRVAPQNGA